LQGGRRAKKPAFAWRMSKVPQQRLPAKSKALFAEKTFGGFAELP
jgi:hypothetical protein